MPFGSLGDIHISMPLTNVAISYEQNEASFIAGRVFPNVNVRKQADLYWVFDRAAANRDEFKLRAPATESAGVTLTISQDSYFARKWALHYDIPDEHRANVDEAINLDRMTTRNLMKMGLIRREKQWATDFFTTGVWGTDITGVTASPGASQVVMWDDATATPIVDIRTAATAMQLRTGGYRPNILVLGQIAYDKLVNQATLIERIKYSSSNQQPAIITRQALAAMFEIDRIEVMGAVENTAKEGLTEVNAFFGSKNALLLYAPAVPNTMEPSAGYTFNFTEYLGNSPNGIRIKKFRIEKIEADRVEAEMFFDMKKTAADLGYFFSQIVR